MTQPEKMTLDQLIERLRCGDEEAREQLISNSCKRLERLTRKMLKRFPGVKRWEDTADVLQNATLRMWRALREVSPPTVADFFRLAAAHVRRELIDLARHYYGPQGMGANHQSQDPRPDIEPEIWAQDPLPPEETDPSGLLAWSELHEQIDALPEDERAVFDLLWYQELTQEQAAQVLDTSVWTVRRHFRNAKLKIAETLGSDLL